MLSSFLSLIMKAPEEPQTRLPPSTLTSLLQDHKVPVETLYARHGAVSTIAKSLLGIVPNTGKYFEIWPPANRMYYFMVPTFLNLPMFMFGYGAPKELVSLALYTSSLAACCPYCSSHTCTFALRRGVSPDKLGIQAICSRHGETSSLYSPIEKSVIDMSELLAVFPCKVTNKDRRTLRDLAKEPETAEAIVLGMAMMGYLNKSMDALGMPLEIETYRETRKVIGETWSPGASGQLVDPYIHTPEVPPPTDSFSTYWSMVKQGPSAVNFERKALAGIPEDAEEATTFLIERYGYGFPVLKSMHITRAMVAVAAMAHECFNPETSVIGIKAKLGVAQIFASITESKPVQEAVNAIAKHFDVSQQFIASTKELASDPDAIEAAKKLFPAEEDRTLQALLVIAHSTSWSPARVDETVVSLCSDAKLEPAAIVEVVAIVSVMQMLHRISMFYLDDDEEEEAH